MVERHPARDQLEDVVIETEILDGDDLVTVHRDADVLHLDAEKQVAAEPSDRQLAVQVLVRFADDVAAHPVAEPGGLRHDNRGGRRADDQRHHDQQHVHESSNNPHDPPS